MSTLQKFIVFKCDTCARETEITLDGRRPDPLRCNITAKCRGKLERQGERTAKRFLFTPTVVGLEDFVPRGTVATPATSIAVEKRIPIFTAGGEGMIAAAVIRKKVISGQAIYYVFDENGAEFVLETLSLSQTLPVDCKVTLKLFELTPSLLNFKKYTYTFASNAQLIQGQDNTPEGHNLRFNTSNRVRVFANGIELSASEFDRTIDNQITLTPAITATNTVIEVIVYNDIDEVIDEDELIDLEFESLTPTIPAELALRALNCWGNYGAATINNTIRYTLFCSDLTVDPEKTYGVARIVATASNGDEAIVRPNEFFILLGREPFAVQDKELFAYVTGTSLVVDDAILIYKQSSASGALELAVEETNITQVFDSIVPHLKIEAAETNNVQGAAETELSKGTELLNRRFILGPS